MKTYMIVTNDEYELPISDEIVGAEETARCLGIKTQRLRRCLMDGFPKKAKYKAVVVQDRQHEDVQQYRRKYLKRYDMTHDRAEYKHQWYQKGKSKGATAMRMDEKVQCPVCGKLFIREPKKNSQRYCSFDCSKKTEVERKKLYEQERKALTNRRSIEPPKKPGKKKKSNMKSIAEIDRLAKEERLSYGQYVAKYGV